MVSSIQQAAVWIVVPSAGSWPYTSTRRMVTLLAMMRIIPVTLMSCTTAPGVEMVRSPLCTLVGTQPAGTPVLAGFG